MGGHADDRKPKGDLGADSSPSTQERAEPQDQRSDVEEECNCVRQRKHTVKWTERLPHLAIQVHIGADLEHGSHYTNDFGRRRLILHEHDSEAAGDFLR